MLREKGQQQTDRKRDNKLEKEQGGVYVRVWRREREGRDDVTIFESH